MNSEFDLQAINIDLNSPPLTHPIRLQTTDFSKILRTLAGVQSPSVPCVVICTAFDLIFTLITLVIGSSNLSACPIENRLPIYLVVCASVNLVSVVCTIIATFIHLKGKEENILGFFCVISSSVLIILFQLFNFIWLICGTVWVFSIFNQVQYTQMNEKTYCQAYIYQYTLASIILQYIIPFVICCCKSLPLLK